MSNNPPKEIFLRLHHITSLSERFRLMDKGKDWEEGYRKLCEGLGYSPDVVERTIMLTKYLKQNPDIEFTVVNGLDTFCEGCNISNTIGAVCKGPDVHYIDVEYCVQGFEVGKRYKIRDCLKLSPGETL